MQAYTINYNRPKYNCLSLILNDNITLNKNVGKNVDLRVFKMFYYRLRWKSLQTRFSRYERCSKYILISSEENGILARGFPRPKRVSDLYT